MSRQRLLSISKFHTSPTSDQRLATPFVLFRVKLLIGKGDCITGKRKYEWFCETFMGRRKVATRKLATRKVATGKVATGLRQSLKIAISGTMTF